MANTDHLWEKVFDLMDREDWTVGVWNMLLSQVFPSPEYIIIPEHRVPGGRADLAVVKTDNQRLVLVVEGKKAGGGFMAFNDALNQARDYMASYASSTPGFVAPLGPVFVFARPDGTTLSGFNNSTNKNGITVFKFEVNNMKKILDKLQKCKEWNGAGGW